MKTENRKEAFPFIRQVILNAFNIESVYLAPPYTNIQQIDRGFRELVWEDYDMKADFSSAMLPADQYHIFVIRSVLEFVNIVCIVSLGETPDLIVLGPFSSEVLKESHIHQIIHSNGLMNRHRDTIINFYHQLPVAATARVLATAQHLIADVVPEFAQAQIVYRDFTEERHSFGTKNDKYISYSARTAELYGQHITEYLDAVTAADIRSAHSALNLLLLDSQAGSGSALLKLKKEFSALNKACCQRILSTTVHPYYVFELMHEFDYAIDHAVSREELPKIAYRLTHKYCLLVKNYAYAEYSCLVRNIVNYVNQHISAPLSLAEIAARFNKNASYLSGLFSREMGCSLTAFIHQERIRHAIQYMGTSQLSISEIAQAVGIDDFAYFSRLFKKQTGKSPSEYRKMLHRGNQ